VKNNIMLPKLLTSLCSKCHRPAGLDVSGSIGVPLDMDSPETHLGYAVPDTFHGVSAGQAHCKEFHRRLKVKSSYVVHPSGLLVVLTCLTGSA
jgi:hypothetical protein